MSLRALAAVFYFCCILILGTDASAEEFNIYLKTSPAMGFLRPFADPVNISVLVTHADGRPVEQGSVGIVLDAPKSGVFWSTDFPVVENSRLLELVLPLRQGRAGWKYLFPIRGDYRLSVTLIASDGKTTARNFIISVAENRTKWLWLGLFCAALFVFGFAAGRVFTFIPVTRTTSWLLLVFAAAGIASGHDAPSSVENIANPSMSLEIAAATVGKPTRLRWRAPNGDAARTLLSLTILHLEKHKTVFAIDKVSVDKEYLLDFHFPDGAEYRVNSIAERPGQEPVRTEQLVAVTGIEPAMTAQLPSLVFFLLVIALGLGAGRLSKTSSAH
ncbi:MAG TPA: hypothetical protein VFK65_23280 [Candidatus Binatia bacterium]|nr:hypothetical protein [Candidatus Binatia bacterium]